MGIDIDLDEGSWLDAIVDIVPDLVGALSVSLSQLDPEVLAAEDDAAWLCRRDKGGFDRDRECDWACD